MGLLTTSYWTGFSLTNGICWLTYFITVVISLSSFLISSMLLDTILVSPVMVVVFSKVCFSIILGRTVSYLITVFWVSFTYSATTLLFSLVTLFSYTNVTTWTGPLSSTSVVVGVTSFKVGLYWLTVCVTLCKTGLDWVTVENVVEEMWVVVVMGRTGSAGLVSSMTGFTTSSLTFLIWPVVLFC